MLEPSDSSTQNETPTAKQPNKLARVFRHRDFRLMWIGAFVSFCGGMIQVVAEGYLVYQISKSEFLLGLVTLFASLPVAFLAPIAGSLSDMVDKRKLLLFTQTVFAIGALFLAAATYFGFVQYWHIVLVAMILGAVSAIDMPARQSVIGRVIPPEDLAVAIPLNAMTFNMARVVGPAIGGILLAAFGPAMCYLINGLSFLALIFSVLQIKADLKATPQAPQPIKDLITEGALYTFRETRLRTIFILEFILAFFGLFYMTQIPAIAEVTLHLGKNLWTIYVAVGVGSILALSTITLFSDRPFRAQLIRICMTLFALGLILLGHAKSVYIAYPIFALMGFSSIAIFNSCNMLFQTLAPERLRGRVLAMHVWALSGLGPFGVLLLSYVAEKVDLTFALTLGGGLVACGALYSFVYRKGLEGVG